MQAVGLQRLFIHYPNYTHKIPNVNPGIFELAYRGHIFWGGLIVWRAYILDIMASTTLFEDTI